MLNSTLYYATYGHKADGTPTSSLTSQGAGWNGYRAIEDSFYWGATVRSARYALRGDGVLYRWDGQTRVVSRYPGYSAVKTMALISEIIKGLGKVPGTYKDPVYYLNTAEGNPPLFGE